MNIIFALLLFMSFKLNIYAEATVSASINVSTTNTIVGNSGTATLTISSNEAIGQIYGTFNCGALGKQDLFYVASASPSNSKSYTINWKANDAGTYTCSVEGLEVGTLETVSFLNPKVLSKTITVVKASSGSSSNKPSGGSSGGITANKKEYSSDNNLKSLRIDGYEFEPVFNKDVVEYRLTVDQSVEKINVSGESSDSKARVNGLGEKSLANGENTIEVKVTAENGNEKVYKLIVTVSDLNPIKVNVGEEEFTVVKKNNDLIKKLDYYEDSVITINDQEVVSYKNTNIDVTLVLLKNSDNEIFYYVYDDKENTYYEYRYINVGGVILQLLDNDKELDNYKKYDLELQNEVVDFYKIKKSNKVGLIYGANIKTGDKGYYVYDSSLETLSKYYDEEVNIYKKEIQDLKNYLMIFIGGVAFVSIIVILISLKKSKKKKINRHKL